MVAPKETWVQCAYEVFAIEGPHGLKIESLARQIGINKSSFYHHFGTLEALIEQLLKHHTYVSEIIANKEKKVLKIDPELIEILVEHKIDLLFNRQLRIHRNNKAFLDTVEKSDKMIGEVFALLWIKELQLTLSQAQLENLFGLALENFYLQINFENLNLEWLASHFKNFKRIAQGLQINGTV